MKKWMKTASVFLMLLAVSGLTLQTVGCSGSEISSEPPPVDDPTLEVEVAPP